MAAVIYLVYFSFVFIFSLIHFFIIKINRIKKVNLIEIVLIWNEIALFGYFIYWAFTAKRYFYIHIGPASWVILIIFFLGFIYENRVRGKYFKSRTTIPLDKAKKINKKSNK